MKRRDDDSGSSLYRDGCPFGIIGRTIVGPVVAAAWLATKLKL